MKLQFRGIVLLAVICASTLQAQSQTPSGEPTVYRDIQYTTIPDSPAKLNQLDVYTPGTPGPHPVLVFIHGGSWRFGDKEMIGDKAVAFTGAGYVFVSINYRLSPAVQHPAHAQDCGKAVAWVHQNIAKYGGDPARLYVLGHSSGAHLAALISTDERYLKEAGASLSAIKGTVVLDGGGYDIPTMVNSGELFAKGRYKRAFSDDTNVWKDASPLNHVAKDKGIPPFLLVHAGDRKASRQQADELGEALKKAAVKTEYFDAPDKNHLSVNSSIGESGDATTKAILDFLDALGARKTVTK